MAAKSMFIILWQLKLKHINNLKHTQQKIYFMINL